MKRNITIHIICMILIITCYGIAATEQITQLETRIAQLATTQQNSIKHRDELQKQLAELTHQIAALNRSDELSYLQRNRLERLMSRSQQVASALETVQREISRMQADLEKQKKALIDGYDDEIRAIMQTLEQPSLPGSEKRDALIHLVEVKNKREVLQAQLDLSVRPERAEHTLTPAELNDANQVKQHIDWLRDQNEQLRADAYELEHIVTNLEEEIEIRDKMAELEHDMLLFDHSDEVFSQTVQTAPSTEKSGSDLFSEPEGRAYDYVQKNPANNAFLEPANNSQSSLLRLYPDLFTEDYSNMNNTDIDRIIGELRKRKKKVISTADSLRLCADNLQRHLEQLENQTSQGNK